MIEKKKKKDDKMVLLSKTKLNTVEVLTFKDFIDWCISLDAFVQINNVLKTYDKMKEKIKNPNNEKKMNLYRIKCSMFTKNTDIKVKRELFFILVVLTAALKSLKLFIKKNWMIY